MLKMKKLLKVQINLRMKREIKKKKKQSKRKQRKTTNQFLSLIAL